MPEWGGMPNAVRKSRAQRASAAQGILKNVTDWERLVVRKGNSRAFWATMKGEHRSSNDGQLKSNRRLRRLHNPVTAMNNNTHRHSFRPAARAGRTRSYIASLALGTALLAAGCADREEVTRQNTATDTDMAYATATPEATTTATTRTDEQLQPTGRVQEDATMVLDEEKLDVQKRTVQEGGVLISKDVETREVTQPVELRTESVEVERLSPEEARQRGISTDQQQRFGEKEVYIPLAREEAVVQKEVQPRAVIQAETTTQTEQENVDATLRREVVDVERRQGGQQQMSTQQGGSQLEQQIRSELRNAQDLNLQDQQINQINIRVEQSRVTLSGTVPEQDMIEKIEQRVRQVQGVQSVENELRAQQ